jgi:hypothetical protein
MALLKLDELADGDALKYVLAGVLEGLNPSPIAAVGQFLDFHDVHTIGVQLQRDLVVVINPELSQAVWMVSIVDVADAAVIGVERWSFHGLVLEWIKPLHPLRAASTLYHKALSRSLAHLPRLRGWTC